MFKRFKRQAPPTVTQPWSAKFIAEGVLVSSHPAPEAQDLGDAPLLKGWLEQLEDEALAVDVDGGCLVPWDAVYAIHHHPEHGAALPMLRLPPQAPHVPVLVSRGSLDDESFSIALAGWLLPGQGEYEGELMGPLLRIQGRQYLLAARAWELVQAVREFAQRTPEQRNGRHHRLQWGRIRALAVQAGAALDQFLLRSVVLTPEKLSVGVRKNRVGEDTVIEFSPTFKGAPPDWLEHFDRRPKVEDRYDILTPDGIVQVVVGPKVRAALEEVKQYKDRRAAGSRAQAFLLNPIAVLGPDLADVIDTDEFEQACIEAGFQYERFLPRFQRDGNGYPLQVGLLIESATPTGPSTSEVEWLDDDQLAKFVRRLKAALDRNHQLLAWNGYDLEMQGDTPRHLEELEQALEARRRPPVLITYDHVYDLTNYGSRVQGIDFEKPYYSPYITKKKEGDAWFPENILQIISWVPEGQTEAVTMPFTSESLAELQEKVADARATGKAQVVVPGTPKPMPLAEAERIASTFSEVQLDAAAGNFDPEKPKRGHVERKAPVLLPNIDKVDYSEGWQAELIPALLPQGQRQDELPKSLRQETKLLPHQLQGVAWLQTLFEASKSSPCRGAVLADDMGLGKTLQLLTFMAWAIEQDPGIAPMLVVAPVSLLENWKEETTKFFKPGALPLLTAYGDGLADLRVPTESIDSRLRTEDRLTRFLKPDWLGNARLVLTTYETLRDLEFSFALQRWSVMVCDEAQKIKNPAAMVTRSAKKQNVGFRVACTGTPVENSLADLWCLFDFVQPGLLGALNEFGRRYGRSIEGKPVEERSDEDKTRLDELRALIAPQILRRTKAEVATNLPRKIVAESCRQLPLSDLQRHLYSQAMEAFKRRKDPQANVPFKNHLGLLQYLRNLCTDPRRHGLTAKPQPLAEYRQHAPKLDWLLNELKRIQADGEKVIIFAEFLHIQRLLQHYIAEVFSFRPDIVNGSTKADASHAQSRHRRIRAFQEKPGFGAIILAPGAVGFGVNIQAANHVIHYTRTWNPAKEDQATDRAYRIGQTRDVYVYYPVVQAPDFTTFDVKLDRLLERKRELAGDMLEGCRDLGAGDFTLEDVAPPDVSFEPEWVTEDELQRMEWTYFEAFTAVLHSKRGFAVHRTPSSRDHGVDVVALEPGRSKGKLIQTKSSGQEDATLGWDAVKDVLGGRAFYERQYPGVQFELVCVTNQFFDKQTHTHAQLNNVELIERPALVEMLARTPVSLSEVERQLYPEWSDA